MSSEKATFGAGCFWGVEAEFRQVKGVILTSVGYAGGSLKDPTYRDVCAGNTGRDSCGMGNGAWIGAMGSRAGSAAWAQRASRPSTDA